MALTRVSNLFSSILVSQPVQAHLQHGLARDLCASHLQASVNGHQASGGTSTQLVPASEAISEPSCASMPARWVQAPHQLASRCDQRARVHSGRHVAVPVGPPWQPTRGWTSLHHGGGGARRQPLPPLCPGAWAALPNPHQHVAKLAATSSV